MSAAVYELPVADNRLAGMAAAPADALALVELAIKRTDHLARLVRKAAPAPEITAAAEAVAALRGPLETLRITGNVLQAAWEDGKHDTAGETAPPAAPAPRRLRSVPCGTAAEVTR